MKNYRHLYLFFIFLFLLACRTDNNSSKRQKLEQNAIKIVERKQFENAELTENAKKLAQSNNQFAFDFYKIMQEDTNNKNKNLVFSPFSLYTVLGITYFNPEQKEILLPLEKIMYLEKNKNLSQDFYDMQGSIINGNKSNEVNVVNGLWLREPNRVGLDYQNIIKKYFEIEVKKITNAHEINTWVSKQTNNKINNIISQSQIDDLSYILLNATYFKGKWASIFEKENTKDEDFTLSNNTKIKVKMMQIFGEDYQFYEDNSLKMVELPYQTNEFSMYFSITKSVVKFENLIFKFITVLFVHQQMHKK